MNGYHSTPRRAIGQHTPMKPAKRTREFQYIALIGVILISLVSYVGVSTSKYLRDVLWKYESAVQRMYDDIMAQSEEQLNSLGNDQTQIIPNEESIHAELMPPSDGRPTPFPPDKTTFYNCDKCGETGIPKPGMRTVGDFDDDHEWIMLSFSSIEYLQSNEMWYDQMEYIGYTNHYIVAGDALIYELRELLTIVPYFRAFFPSVILYLQFGSFVCGVYNL